MIVKIDKNIHAQDKGIFYIEGKKIKVDIWNLTKEEIWLNVSTHNAVTFFTDAFLDDVDSNPDKTHKILFVWSLDTQESCMTNCNLYFLDNQSGKTVDIVYYNQQ